MSGARDSVYVLDRMEEGHFVLVCEGQSIAVDTLPHGIRMGDSLVLRQGEWCILNKESEIRRQCVRDKMDRIFKK